MKSKAMKLPSQLRDKKVGNLTKADLKLVHNSLDAYEIIQSTYADLWKVLGPALKAKQRIGFCAVSLSCTNTTDGTRRACNECAKKLKIAAEGRGGKSQRLSAYQKWRRVQ